MAGEGSRVKTCIYYFSGTGNSLAAAKQICEALGDCELVSIASLGGVEGAIVPEAERVGIVCPIYDFGLPAIVAAFARRLHAPDDCYLFAVITFGGAGKSALTQLDGILRERGRGLDAAWAVAMPGNFPPIARPPEGRKREEILAKADTAIAKVTEKIRRREHAPPEFTPVTSLLRSLTYPPFIRNVHGADGKFWLTGACTSCGTCEKVCPVGNIEIVDGRPVWQHRCQLCMACLHFCPVEAIQWGKRTEHRGRYRHHRLTVQDMETQQG
ncbi:MAG: EFR1 family ferrodoxin [Methanomicrobiaceae archaeon]|nr:EFR1 family ferrodoxin [Methanomicrobiaceae archaeon]